MAASEANIEIEIFNQPGQPLPLSESDSQRIASAVMVHEKCAFRLVEIVYVDEKEIIRINKQYLDRDYVTDIISFRYDESTDNERIEVTLYCCAPRIREQSREFDEPVKREFFRILIHGLLHLVGYEDQPEEEKDKMRARENFYLKEIT